MTRPILSIELPTDSIRIVRWDDPVLDATGHDPRSPYVERFWLSLLGPSTTLLVRRLAAALEESPEGFDLHLEDTARSMGLGIRGGRTGPFHRALARTGQFHITRATGPAELAARTRLQTLSRHQVDRLCPALQAEHAAWAAQQLAAPTLDQRRTRARRLALSLLELGETVEATELQLHRWKIHPGMAHEAMRWAQARRSGTPEGAAAATASEPLGRGAVVPPPPPRPRPVFDPAGDAA